MVSLVAFAMLGSVLVPLACAPYPFFGGGGPGVRQAFLSEACGARPGWGRTHLEGIFAPLHHTKNK